MESRNSPAGPSAFDADLRAMLRDCLFLEPGAEEQQLAFEKVGALLEHAPEDCWRLVELAAETDLTNEQAAYFAAGPLEDLMSVRGDDFIARLEAAARRVAGMRILVAGLWRGGMSQAIWERVLALRQTLGIEPL